MTARVGILLLLMGACASVSAAPVREQFAYAAPIEVWPGSPLQWFEVPQAVYRDAAHPGLSDLRVLNGRGEVVPFALQRPASAVPRPVSELQLPLFPLRGDPADALSALSLTIRGDSASIEMQRGTQAPEAPLTAYLFDARHLEAAIQGLLFEVPASAPDFSVSAGLDVSNDLVTWRELVALVPLARLRNAGAMLENRKVSFTPTRARFWRLRAPAGATLPEFAGVLALPEAGNVAVDRQVIAAPGRPGDADGEYVFDLGAQVPVDRLELELPNQNTAATVEYFARRAPAEPWRRVKSFGVYRLLTANDELRSSPLIVATDASRYWKVVVDPRGGGLGSGVPDLRAGWLAHRVLFVARGDGPFELVYGSFSAENAEAAIADILPGGTLPADATLPQPLAKVGEPRLAGGLERLDAPPPPANWHVGLLWAALGLGVLTLAAIAWRLARQMREGS